jgi:hypothetical protein
VPGSFASPGFPVTDSVFGLMPLKDFPPRINGKAYQLINVKTEKIIKSEIFSEKE